MRYEFTDPQLASIFAYADDLAQDLSSFCEKQKVIKILWNRNEQAIEIEIDGLPILLPPQHLLTVTYFHHLHIPAVQPPLTTLAFNREFYCIIDHDEEVGCNGILFFGTQDLPIIALDSKHQRKLDLLMEVILDEFQTKDNIQGDMLQMLLKRLIILITRLAKQQLTIKELDDQQIDIIRQFNVLVDMHFREKKKVKEYAALLYKSPKTLSNLFASYQQQTPQQMIQERILLEAKRLLQFTDKQTQEIAHELGFEDPAYFSRFFKKGTGYSPTLFKEKMQNTP